jgi:predicted phosphodiesterase
MQIKVQNDSFLVEVFLKDSGDYKSLLCISDLHFDSKKCNRKALKAMMDEAVERNAHIAIFGDILDIMGAKFDPRSSKGDIRPEYSTNNYFMDVLDDAVRFFGPYSDRILFLSMGNHEDSVKKRHEFDLLSIMSYKLKQEYNWKGLLGPYEGWILFRVLEGATNHNRGTVKAYYTHGAGGNAPVTRGVIQSSRRQVQISADMFISGHIHTQFSFPIPQRMVNSHGVEEIKDIVHLQLGCFKESHRGSWEAQRGFGPANIGGYWVKFFVKDKKPRFIEERTIY